MNALRKMLAILFACTLALTSLFAGANSTVAQGREMTFHCDPRSGMTVDEVDSFDDLENCGLVDADTPVPDGKVSITVVVGDLPVGGNAVREPVADHSWMNGFVFGGLPAEPVADDELYVAKGDILGNGRCAVTIFEAGDSVEIYSEGTWQMVRIYNGDADDRMAEARFVAEKAQREVGGAQFCPFVNPSDLVDPYADLQAVENDETEVPEEVETINNTPAETPEDLTGDAENQDVADPNAGDPDVNANNGAGVQQTPLGQNVWEGEQLSLPDPVPADSWLVLKGDVDQSRGGQCSIMAFGAGESPSGYSSGTWDAIELTGSSDADYLTVVESMAAEDCPVVRAPNGA